MIVWQDAVAMFWEKPWTEKEGYRSEPEKRQFELELKRMVEVCVLIASLKTVNFKALKPTLAP